MKRGAFILLEGVDRSGKTTQCKRLVEELTRQGIKTKLAGFPNRTTVIGKQINAYLQNQSEVEDHCIHLLFSANRWEAMNGIVSDLEKGYTIICDRYFASGVAFSAAKGLDMEWCLSPDRGLPSPDLICFLDLSEQEQRKRGGFGNERYEVSSFQTAVRQKFIELMDFLPALNWKHINADGTADDVYAVLQKEVLKAIEESEDKAIGVLCSSLLQ
ncbi:hypothetical protein WA556_002168 [Blastocystis sp. ATCC 50177/Nand II]